MRRQSGTSDLAETRDDVDHSRWEAGLLDELGGDETTEWGLLSSLQNHDVTRSNSGSNLPCPHEQGEVPWDDLGAHANGLLLDVVEGVWGGIHDLALDLVGPAAIVSQATRAHADVHLGHGLSLAVVESLHRGEQLEVLLKEIGELDQQLATVLGRLLSPWALECLACGGDGDVDILLGGLVHRGDDLLGGGVDDLEGLAVHTLHPLIVDEAAVRQRPCLQGGGMGSCTYSPVGWVYLPDDGVSS